MLNRTIYTCLDSTGKTLIGCGPTCGTACIDPGIVKVKVGVEGNLLIQTNSGPSVPIAGLDMGDITIIFSGSKYIVSITCILIL